MSDPSSRRVSVVLLAEVGQVLIALGFSATVAYWLGVGAYLAVALFVIATAWLLMFDAARREALAIREIDPSVLDLIVLALTMGGTAVVFAAIWPALPPILAWSAYRRRGATARRRSDDQDCSH